MNFKEGLGNLRQQNCIVIENMLCYNYHYAKVVSLSVDLSAQVSFHDPMSCCNTSSEQFVSFKIFKCIL